MRKRTTLIVIGVLAFALSGAIPALGGPQVLSAAGAAKTAKKALKLAKKANKKATAALNEADVAGPTGPKGDKGDPGAPPAVEAPTVVTEFENGWETYDPKLPVTYFKDLSGVVHLSGAVKGGSGIVFRLPAGYRPAQAQYQPVTSTVDGGFDPVPGTFVEVCAITFCNESLDGAVTPFGEDPDYVAFDGVTFRAR